MGDYENRLGTLIIGVFFNTYLFGIVSTQYSKFYSKRFDDPLTVRLRVVYLLFTDCLMTAIMLYLGWYYFIENFANADIVSSTPWPYAFIPIGTAATAIVSHLSMSHRIYCLSRSLPLFCALVVAALGAFGTGIAFGVGACVLPSISSHIVLRTLVTWWLGIQVALDLSIAVLLILFLYRHRTTSEETNTVINRLVRGAVQTGFLPTLFAIAGLIAFLIQPESNLYIMFVIPIGRVYTTTFMDGLNVRDELKDKLLKPKESDTAGSELVWRKPGKIGLRAGGREDPEDPLSSRPGPSSQIYGYGGPAPTLTGTDKKSAASALGLATPTPVVLPTLRKPIYPWD